MTPEEIKAGHAFPPNGGRPALSSDQQTALAQYMRVRGDPKLEQQAVLKLAALGMAPSQWLKT